MSGKIHYSNWDDEDEEAKRLDRELERAEAEYIRDVRGDDEHDRMIDEELLNDNEE